MGTQLDLGPEIPNDFPNDPIPERSKESVHSAGNESIELDLEESDLELDNIDV